MPACVVTATAAPQRNPAFGKAEVRGVEVDRAQAQELRALDPADAWQVAQRRKLFPCCRLVLALDLLCRCRPPGLCHFAPSLHRLSGNRNASGNPGRMAGKMRSPAATRFATGASGKAFTAPSRERE